MENKPILIIGAGPAGLGAAYSLVKRGIRPMVLEKADRAGGMARTENYNGYYFDLGGHRFITKIDEINRLWQEILPEDFLRVPRKSRIYYQGRFFNYPLDFFNTLVNLGAAESVLFLSSYLKAQLWPFPVEESFEQWVSNRFGRRLYQKFFKIYTEKIWGLSCDRIRADWAAQRIKGLSLAAAVSNALFGIQTPKSMISEFHYPLKGPGMMWQRFQDAIEAGGGQLQFNAELVGLEHQQGSITRAVCLQDGEKVKIPVEDLISSIPLTCLVRLLDPPPPDRVLDSASRLSYRAFIIVLLIVDKADLFPDQWIYIHSPEVRVGRIQNFKNWSAAMVPDPQKTSVGLEYFCSVGDEIWTMSDSALAEVALKELSQLGLADPGDVIDMHVVRQPEAYPIYHLDYQTHLKVIRDFLGTLDNLQTIGRGGMHRYNNMDHAMQTGILAADNYLGSNHDLWQVNAAGEYLEEDRAEARPLVPAKVLKRTFARMDKLAFATAVGCVSGLLFFLATVWLIVKGGDVVGPNLQLLSQYFIGYSVNLKGAYIAFGYSFGWGFLFGWLFAYLRNLFMAFYLYRVKKKTELRSLKDFIDYL